MENSQEMEDSREEEGQRRGTEVETPRRTFHTAHLSIGFGRLLRSDLVFVSS